jgi:hypothetical protein
MKLGARFSIKIMSEWDLRQEAKRYLYFLARRFHPAVDQVNKRNTTFEILPGLTIGDIYSDSDFTCDQFSNITVKQLENTIREIAKELDNWTPFTYFIEASSVAALLSNEYDYLYNELCEIVGEVFDPSGRIFSVLGLLYMNRLCELTDELIENDSNNGFKFYFHLLFETRSAAGVQLWLNNKCGMLSVSGPEARCIYLFKLVNKFRDEYLGHKASPGDGDTIEFVDSSICLEKQVLVDGSVSFNIAVVEKDSSSNVFLAIRKITEENFSKITVNSFRNRFVMDLKTIYLKQPGDIDKFIENHFHFIGQRWEPMNEVLNFPVFMSTKLAFILNCYKEEGLLEVSSKEYLIHWMAFRFYGFDGYTPHTIRRPFYTKSGRKLQRRIRKKLLEQLESEYFKLFTGPKILHFLN